MDNMIYAVIGNKKKPLHFSINVMFSVIKKYKSVQHALEIMENGGEEGFKAVQFLAVEMANDAELCRRAAGYDPEPFIEESDVSVLMKPGVFVSLQDAICQAISEGYAQEQSDENEETDLGLLELLKKTKAGN